MPKKLWEIQIFLVFLQHNTTQHGAVSSDRNDREQKSNTIGILQFQRQKIVKFWPKWTEWKVYLDWVLNGWNGLMNFW